MARKMTDSVVADDIAHALPDWRLGLGFFSLMFVLAYVVEYQFL